MLLLMPADDHPIVALDRQLGFEDITTSSTAKILVNILSWIPLKWPFDSTVAKLKEHLAADSSARIKLMLETCKSEILKLDSQVSKLKDSMSEGEVRHRSEVASNLLLDGARKAASTRSLERVTRIGLILANGLSQRDAANGDEIEEMMRVAMDLGDQDVKHLRELARVEGPTVEISGRIERYEAYRMWELCSWGTRIDSELDSVFSKLTAYGLVAQIPPPNNLNIGADFQNRYVLLSKGLRFFQLTQEKVA
jgi:hypothetical protein